MPDPSKLRDSTQIVLPVDELEEVRDELEAEFTLTIFGMDEDHVRIIGSPVEIKAASDFLARRGVSLP
ncbi:MULTISPECIES: hypothetical protein [Halorussus]|uniref:VNG_1110C family protein n=1 Tax=Halorussus TaxID=1070314 RepID=UPI00209FB151|nr:hypothetical protein [Halorussus vallis]USZ75885.1 hypothetical protein NGM07_00850 [Halorussus vallis]